MMQPRFPVLMAGSQRLASPVARGLNSSCETKSLDMVDSGNGTQNSTSYEAQVNDSPKIHGKDR